MEDLIIKARESLKEQFDSSKDLEKIIINNCLLPEISNNPEFATKILAEGKSIPDMFSKIMDWVRKSKNYSPSHDVIFSAAIHYFQEDNPEFVEEIFKEEPLVFGDIHKEFNTPIVKYITGTIIRETIKEVTSSKDTVEHIEKKVKKTISDKTTVQDQLTIDLFI
jgi:hypothetical protein